MKDTLLAAALIIGVFLMFGLALWKVAEIVFSALSGALA